MRLWSMTTIFFIFGLPIFGSDLGPCDEKKQEITLQEALDQAFKSNLNLQIERLSPLVAEQNIREAWGVFNPELTWAVLYDDKDTPLTSQYSVAAGGLSSTQAEDLSASSGFNGKIPTGTQYQLGFQTLGEESTFNQFNSEYQNTFTTKIIQPLLKDFGVKNQLAWVRISKNQQKQSQYQLTGKMMDLIFNVEQAYWNLFFASENLGVKKASLKLAEDFLHQAKIKAKVGAMSALEVIQVEAEAALRQEQVLEAQEYIVSQEMELKKQIFSRLIHQRCVQLIAQGPVHIEKNNCSITEGIKTALKRRPDFQSHLMEVKNARILLKYYSNQSLPRLDLEGTLSLNGLEGGFGNAQEELMEGDHPSWGAGVVFRFPLGNEIAKARRQKSRLELKQAILKLKSLENEIVYAVEKSVRQLELKWKRVEASQVTLNSAQAALDAEKKKFETGVSTTHNVFEFEEKKAQAQSRRLQAQIEYVKAQSELERLQGILLEERGYQLD